MAFPLTNVLSQDVIVRQTSKRDAGKAVKSVTSARTSLGEHGTLPQTTELIRKPSIP